MASFLGVVDGAGDVADLVADGEGLFAAGVVLEFGAVEFEPEPFGALAKGDDF